MCITYPTKRIYKPRNLIVEFLDSNTVRVISSDYPEDKPNRIHSDWVPIQYGSLINKSVISYMVG